MRNSTCYQIAGTKTFRLSSKKILGRWGDNLQNIEKSQRENYIPDKGKIFVQVDQAGAEALIVAYLSRPGKFRELFQHGIKPHVYVALQLFKDVWSRKMIEHHVITSLDHFNIDEICATPIALLKQHPLWSALKDLIADSDNWSLQERYYYLAKQTCHCVDAETEVLTERGWLKCSNYNGERIAIAGINREIKFEVPTKWNIFDFTGDMYKFKGEETEQVVTPNHRIVYNTNNKDRIGFAASVARMQRINIPTSGYYNGSVNWPDWKIKFLVAAQADGYIYSKSSCRFRFQKQRKVDRLKEILQEGGIEFEERQTDAKEILIYNQEELLSVFWPIKEWGSWLLTLSQNNLNLLVEELKFWDGCLQESHHHKREKYSTAIVNNATWIKIVCHLTGRQGTIYPDVNIYDVGINNRKKSIVKTISKINYAGKVYCPTTSTGMFLIRRSGKISITGNSGNYDIMPPMFRMNILVKSGGKIVISKEDSERFLGVYRSMFDEIPEWHQQVRRTVESTMMLYNLFGHPFTITQPTILETQWKELYAWCPQSTVGEITNIAVTETQQFIEESGLDWDILANTHDSFLVQCPEAEAQVCAGIMTKYIQKTFTSPYDGVQFTMGSEAQAGYNWAPAKKDKNLNGLRTIKV